MEYRYIAYTNDRRVVKGSLSATSLALAQETLLSRGYEPISLAKRAPGPSLEVLSPSLFAVKPEHIIDMSKQLALLLECGVNISAALQL